MTELAETVKEVGSNLLSFVNLLMLNMALYRYCIAVYEQTDISTICNRQYCFKLQAINCYLKLNLGDNFELMFCI